jgi:hypothetical protein
MFDENTSMFLAATLDGHKKMKKIFSEMTSSQVKDAVNIGIDTFGMMTPTIEYKTLHTTLNDLFGHMISAVASAEYCVDKKYMKLVATIILGHAYYWFYTSQTYIHWPKTAVSEYLTYFEGLLQR